MRKKLQQLIYGRNWSFWFTALLIMYFGRTQAQISIRVEPAVQLIDGNFPPYNELQAGDTIKLLPGNRELLILRNINGSPDKPIVITNAEGIAEINSNHYFGISIRKSSHFKLTGTGDPNEHYGIRILNVRGSGLSIGDYSSNFEIDHVEIGNTLYSGLIAKTEPDCDFQRSEFTQENTIIHDCYIHQAGNEGMYIGSSFYSGQTLQCNGKPVVVYPAVLDHVEVYNNRVEFSGWDGIQVSSANDAHIHHNVVKYDSQAKVDWQMTGITLGGGSNGSIHANLIEDGEGTGIFSNALGDVVIYNNIIRNPGKDNDKSSSDYGIYTTDQHALPGMHFEIFNNLILESRKAGIRMIHEQAESMHRIYNNAIVKSNLQSMSYPMEDLFIDIIGDVVNKSTNYCSAHPEALQLKSIQSSDYSLKRNSPLVDAGSIISRNDIQTDLAGNARLQGSGTDIGPIESAFDNPIMVAIHDSTLSSDIAFPNPVSVSEEIAAIQFDTQLPGLIAFVLIDEQGRQIEVLKEVYFENGHHFELIDATRLQKGFNYIQVRKPRHSSVIRILKQEQ